MDFNFDLFQFLILLLIAGICGAAAQAITGFTRGGCLVSIALGFIGALVGYGLARLTGLPELIPVTVNDVSFPIVWAIIGATVFALIVGLLSRRRPPEV